MGPADAQRGSEASLSPWIDQAVRARLASQQEAARCSQLLRTADLDAFKATAPSIWRYGEPTEAEKPPEPPPPPPKGKAAAAAPVEEVEERLEAANDPAGGALCVSHAWDAPFEWEQHFGSASYIAAKQIQASTGVTRAAARLWSDPWRQRAGSKAFATQPVDEGGAASAVRVWVDAVSTVPPVSPSDHPLEQTVWGPFRLPVRELRAMFVKADCDRGYTILRLNESRTFQAAMQMRTWDERERPSKSATSEDVHWELSSGEYHVLSAHVIPEDYVSPAMAESKRHFAPQLEHLLGWCGELALRDEVWVEMTLGSVTCECLVLTESMLLLHSALVAVLSWNYFDRLWPLVEWAVFAARRGPDRIQLAADAFVGPARVEYFRAIRRINVAEAGCRDPRDRELLLSLVERVFACKEQMFTEGYAVPQPCGRCANFSNDCVACKSSARQAGAAARAPAHAVKSTLTVGSRSVALRDIAVPERRRVVDYSKVERYVRATAIATFAREQARVSCGAQGYDDEGGWTALAEDVGLSELHAVLKKCKPRDWFELVEGEALPTRRKREVAYLDHVERWWRDSILPVLEDERRLAARV